MQWHGRRDSSGCFPFPAGESLPCGYHGELAREFYFWPGEAFQFDADGEIVAAFAAFPARHAGVPGACVDVHELEQLRVARERSMWIGRDGKVVLFEGDGGLLFHIQELETIKRLGYRILICAMNDGGYGSEFHKLRADGVDDSQAIFGRPKFEEIAKGFGLRGIANCFAVLVKHEPQQVIG